MKILLVNDYLNRVGGTEKFVDELKEELIKKGNEVLKFGHNGKEDINSYFSRFYSLKWRRRMKKTIQEFKPDVIHINNFTRILSPSIIKPCIESRAKVIITFHDFSIFHSDNSIGKFKRSILKKVLKKYMDYLTFVSPSEILAKDILDFTNKRGVEIINNGVKIPEEYTIYDGSIFYVGGETKEKGLHIVEEEIIKSGRKFHKLTNFERPPEDFYKKSSILVVPSTIKENFPYVVLEGMSYGLLIIASNIGGIKEQIINARTGILFTPGDKEDFKEKLNFALRNPERIKDWGMRARERVKERFSLQRMVDKYLVLYSTRNKPPK